MKWYQVREGFWGKVAWVFPIMLAIMCVGDVLNGSTVRAVVDASLAGALLGQRLTWSLSAATIKAMQNTIDTQKSTIHMQKGTLYVQRGIIESQRRGMVHDEVIRRGDRTDLLDWLRETVDKHFTPEGRTRLLPNSEEPDDQSTLS
jgi:hypothetical protein